MSEVIILKQYDGSTVTPTDDAIVYDAVIKQSGIINGCDVTYLGSNKIQISEGRGIIKGRQFVVTAHTINVELSTAATQSGRIYIHMDLSDTEQPVQILSVTAAALPALVQEENCNETNGIYEIELATYSATTLTVENLIKTITTISAEAVTVSDLTDTVPYNLIPFPYYEGNHTDNGIDWVVNEDGSVTANGTATADSLFQLRVRTSADSNILTLKAGTYTLSGVPTNITSDLVYLTIVRTNPSTGTAQTLCMLTAGIDSKTFSVSEDSAVTIGACIRAGQTVENLTFKPMLVKGDTAKEYHKNFKSVYEQQEAIIDDLEEIEAVTEEKIPAGALALKAVNAKLADCWIAFEDEEGNPTTEPYIHWLAEEEEASE